MTQRTVTRDEYGDRPRTKELRVRFVMHLMATGRWVKGETGQELREAWDLSIDAINQDAAEASRRVQAAVDPNWVRQRLTVALDQALEDARGDPKATAAVANAFASVIGVQAKHVTVTAENTAGQPVFRIELNTPERPT